MKKLYLWVALLLLAGPVTAQLTPFAPYAPEAKSLTSDERRIQPYKAHFSQLGSGKALASLLASADEGRVSGKTVGVEVSLPDPNGELVTFKVYRYQMITPELQALYPDFVTLHGYDVTDVTRRVRMDWTSKGFGAAVTGGREGRWHMDPLYTSSTEAYQSYYSVDERGRPGHEAVCSFEVDEKLVEEVMGTYTGKAVGDCTFREYRLALACTGEYYQAVDGGNGQADVIAEMMRAINRVNEVYERDLALRTNIINLPDGNGNVQLVYSDGANDPYTNNDGSIMLGENQQTVDAIIGPANYDIGHVFSTGGGGIAAVDSPCDEGRKAQGVTGLPNPTGEGFYIDFVAHEMGHQFGGTHTFNSPGTPGDGNDACTARDPFQAYEPGGGTTIQAYAGICGADDNVQSNSSPYYHAGSIRQITAYMELGGGAACASVTAADQTNTQPVITEPQGEPLFTIPAATPFFLDAAATDGDGDAITYCWEQFDAGDAVVGVPTGTETTSALFRSFPPTSSPRRYFPTLESVVTGNNSEWEVLPQVTREMDFVVTVRDFGAAGYGCLVQEFTLVDVVATGMQFDVLAPNGGEAYAAGSQQAFTWRVAGTDANGIDCANVDLMLSTDGGQTFTTSLGTFPNNGSATVTLPTVTTTTARLMVVCSDNIFYEVSDADFSIEQTDFALSADETSANTCSGQPTYSFTTSALQGFTGTVNYSFANLPGPVTAAANPTASTFTAGGNTAETVSITLMNADQLASGNYTFDLVATDDNNVMKTLTFDLEVEGDFTLNSPTDGQFLPINPDGSGSIPLDWAAVPGATTYSIFFGGSNVFTTADDRTSITLGQPGVTQGQTQLISVRANPGNEVTCVVMVTFGDPPPATTSLSDEGTSPANLCEGRQASDYRVSFMDNELTGPATLAVTQVPGGVTATLSQTTVMDGESAFVSLDGEENLGPGQYIIEVTATDGNSATETLELVLDVEEDGVTVVAPAEDDAFVETQPNPQCGQGTEAFFFTFDWDPVTPPAGASVTSYTFMANVGNTLIANETTAAGDTEIFIGRCLLPDEVVAYTVTANFSNGESVSSCTRTVTLSEAPVLPVTWLNFTARPNGKTSQLNWRVNQDEAHAGFQVQRSMNGVQDWQNLAWVERLPANGEASYGYTDLEVVAGTYYYRLQQEDNDGRQSYSTIESVTFSTSGELLVYPNPVTNLLQVRLGEAAGAENVEYQLLNNLGQLVRSGRLQAGRATVNVAELPMAVYQLLVSNAEGVVASKRVVVK